MILIVDDDKVIRMSLGMLLKREGFETVAAANAEEALAVVRREPLQLIIMDMNYTRETSGEEGLELLMKVKIFQPAVPVILITAWGSIPLAVEGMKAGAFDFITKPWNNYFLMQRIRTAISLNAGEPEAEEETAEFDRAGIVGSSPELMAVLDTVRRVAPTDAPVLITGENGTGKELIARALHLNSPRRREQMVTVNLGGISQSLFESEMFGHVKGAFTGATANRKGRFEMAHKGTIFLDEIGDLDIKCQVKGGVRHQRRPSGHGSRPQVPRRPSLPNQPHNAASASAARAARRHSGAGAPLCGAVNQAWRGILVGGHGPADTAAFLRQYP